MNNLSIYEEDCDFTGYNSKAKKAICSFFTKMHLPFLSEIKIDKENFLQILRISEILVILKCFLV